LVLALSRGGMLVAFEVAAGSMRRWICSWSTAWMCLATQRWRWARPRPAASSYAAWRYGRSTFGEGAPADGRYSNGQPGELLHNQCPLLYQRAAREAAQAAKPGDVVFLARAGYSGSQPDTTDR
jgi:hypothetical protein